MPQTIRVKMPDGTVAEFPAGLTPEQITKAIQETQNAPKAPPTSTEVMHRFVNRLGENITAPIVHPIETAKGIVTAPYNIIKSHMDEGQKAYDSAKRGEYGKAVAQGVASVVPVVGPMVESRLSAGEAPELAADLAMFMVPAAVGRIGRAMKFTNPNMAEASALRFAQDAGVPVDAATATGNTALKNMQQVAEKVTISGAKIGQRGQQATQEGLATLGEHLASQAGRGTPTTMLAAGEEARNTLTGQVRAFGKAADAPYEKIRAAERAGTVTGVNITKFQQELKPVYDQLVRESQLVPPQGATGRALVALDRLMNADPAHGAVPLSVADGALGELKAALRKAGESEPWSKGAGVLRKAVEALDKRVMETAKVHKLDMDLQEGRAATIAKYNVADVLDDLGKEPAATVHKLLAQKDRAVSQLRQIRKYAPEAVGEMGKAYLDDLIEKSSEGQTFGHADKLYAEWSKLGPATKRELFADQLKKNPDYISNLDRFFLAAKTLQKSMNPTGSGYAAASAAHAVNLARGGLLSSVMAELGGAGLSAALRSPTVARVLTRGVTVPMASTAARASYLVSLAKAFQAEGLPVPSFAAAQKEKQ